VELGRCRPEVPHAVSSSPLTAASMRWASMKATQSVHEWSFKKASPSALQRWRILFLVTLWGTFGAVFLLDVRSLRGVGATGTNRICPCTSPSRQSASSRNALADLDDDGFMGGSILDSIKALDVEEMREAGDVIDEDREMAQRRDQKLKVGYATRLNSGILNTAIEFLFPEGMKQLDGRYSGTYVDCTFGVGGYTEFILARLSDSARVFAFDIDPAAIELGQELEQRDSRFHIFHRPYADIGKVLQGEDIHGIIFDIGTSSPQIENKDRGFSCQNLAAEDGPLDLRMNSGAGESAAEWLQTTSVEELAWVLHHYGPDKGTSLVAERVAQAIMDEQAANGPFTLMGRFAEVIGRTTVPVWERFEHPYNGKEHPARGFLEAICVYLNQEREQYLSALPQVFDLLVPGGRYLANVFRNWEAEALLEFAFHHQEPDEDSVAKIKKRRLRELYPLLGTDLNYSVRLLGLPRATNIEINIDQRARTGAFFIMEKGSRHVKLIKAKARLERSRFKQPPSPMVRGAASDDKP